MCGRVNSAQVSDKQSSGSPAGTKSKQLGPNLLQSASAPQTDRFFAQYLLKEFLLFAKTKKNTKNRRENLNFEEVARGPDAWVGPAGKMKMESQEVAAKCGNTEVSLTEQMQI